MFRIIVRESTAAAKAYYTEKARQDYYSEGQEILGNWGGKGAARLGLEGTVESQPFENLCDNINPNTGTHLTPRTRQDRIPGYDLNFHCPKSVSVVYAWNNDRRIVEALLRAVRDTMTEAEINALTRIRKDGQADGNRVTGELTWAEFLHLTARPEGKFPDPHLHVHCFVFNATFDPVEKEWKAVNFRAIYDLAPYYQAAFMTRLANNLMAIGYNVRPVAHAFEIAGVPDELIKQFSKRTAKIKATAEKLGIKDPKQLDKLGALTRKAKKSDLTFPELCKWWRQEVSEENRVAMDRFLRTCPAARLGKHPLMMPEVSFEPPPPHGKRKPTAATALALLGPSGKSPPRKVMPADPSVERAALDRAIQHVFYRASVATEGEILAQAMARACGSGLTPESLREAMKKHPEFIFGEIKGKKLVTTHTVVAEERKIIAWVKAGMGTLPPLIPGYQIKDKNLNQEQQSAVLHVLNSRDRVTAIEGKSGTGKTWLMREAVPAMEAAGARVLVVAPSTQAVQETLRVGGFPSAQTVEQLLVNERLQEQYRNGILWLDEAGMISGRSMVRLFTLAEKIGARIVTTGDVGQHRAVERGDALRMLYDYADLKPAMVTTIMRQQGDYKEWVELLAQGRVPEAFEKMDAGGVIHEKPEKERYQWSAELYLKRIAEGRRVGVIAPTHLEGKKMTDAIRAARKAQGELKKDTPIMQLKQIDMSPADITDWRSYRPGWMIEFFKAMPTSATGPVTQAGTRHVIDHIDYENGAIYLKVKDAAGHEATRHLDLEKYADRFAVYEPDEIDLAPGDRIRITKNGSAEYGRSRVFRGAVHTFSGFDERGDLTLENGQVLKRDFAHLTYGYYSTSIGAQSKTFDHVIVVESPVSFAAGSREQIYVSVGRGKIRPEIVTSNKVDLLEAVMGSSQRHSAMEMVEPKPEMTPQPENFREELREAQKRAEGKMKPEERAKLQLGRHRKVQALTPEPQPETLKEKLEHGKRVPVPEKPLPEWMLPAAYPRSEDLLKKKLGGHPELTKSEKFQWKQPAPDKPTPEKSKPEWMLPAIYPRETAESLKKKLGRNPEVAKSETLEWELPATHPRPEPEPKEPEMDEGMQPGMSL